MDLFRLDQYAHPGSPPDCSDDRAINKGERHQPPMGLSIAPCGNISELILEFKESISRGPSGPRRTTHRAVPSWNNERSNRWVAAANVRAPAHGAVRRCMSPAATTSGDVCGKVWCCDMADRGCITRSGVVAETNRDDDRNPMAIHEPDFRAGSGVTQAHAHRRQRDRACSNSSRSGCTPVTEYCGAEPVPRASAAIRKRWSVVHS